MKSHGSVVVAAVQAAPVFLDREATIDKACNLISKAGAEHARIVAFPECFVPGYPYWFLFHSAYESKPWSLRLFDNAIDVPGPDVDRLCAAARSNDTYVAIGINERMQGTRGTLFNTMLLIDPAGKVIGRHRKIVPTFTERLVHAPGDAAGLRVHPTPFGELGGLICGENTNPLARFALYSEGERIHVASWPAFPTKYNQRNREGAELRVRNLAFEGKVFVISASGVLDEDCADMICRTPEQRALIVSSGGVSAIVAPDATYLAGPLREGEGILTARLDLEMQREVKLIHDVVGHYNRPDLFHLTVDRRRRSLVTFEDAPGAIVQGAASPATTRDPNQCE